MFILFRTFRKILLGAILLVSVASLVLSLYLKPHFVHPNSAYVLVGILDTLILAIFLSISRKKLLASPQPVATEVLGLFTLLPFALILVLYALSITVIPDPTILGVFAILQILIFIGTILHGLYTLCLIATAMLTVCLFDRDVWCRDIDSSPSPFPMSVLFGFICPCCFASPDPAFFEDIPEQEHEALVPCLPGCNCSIAKTKTLANISESEGPGLEPTPEMRMGMVGGLSSRSLVLVPNEVERRTSIMISFEEAAYEV
ncbi:hypothetical protein C8F04DRAFT_1255291 [Mycena alexandri]|uniref:Uncharacterized protein n=1 Tax=Mycena alexandri TaxID=1745969 RepID=A0AAD6T4L9_9AGAR|nr:hypothetical protein C8F04DRAFT_1255291 [Mycena alexandri]